MHLVKFFVELRYKEPHKLFRVYEELYASFTGKETPERPPIILPGFSLRVQERKMLMVVDPQRSVVDLEYVPNPGYCLDTVSQSFRRINELAPLPLLTRLGARSWWIRPSPTPFDELVSRYKEKLLKTSSFVKSAIDVGISFIFDHEGYKVNISFGPMQRTQLRNMLFSKPEDLPAVLTFLDVDYYSVGSEGFTFSERELRDFCRRALDFARNQGEQAESELIGELQ